MLRQGLGALVVVCAVWIVASLAAGPRVPSGFVPMPPEERALPAASYATAPDTATWTLVSIRRAPGSGASVARQVTVPQRSLAPRASGGLVVVHPPPAIRDDALPEPLWALRRR